MAVYLEEKQKSTNWFAIITVILIIGLLGIGFYFLFFAVPPIIEVIVPPILETTMEITKVQFDPALIINSDNFKSLRSYTGLPTIGSIGRENPFIIY